MPPPLGGISSEGLDQVWMARDVAQRVTVRKRTLSEDKLRQQNQRKRDQSRSVQAREEMP
jgi:hypothetical protein